MKILKILVILCSLFIVTLSFADDDYEVHHKNLEYLNLNKQQYNEIKDILIKYKKDYQKFYEFKFKKEKELGKIMTNNYFDKKKYIQIYNEIRTNLVNIEAKKFESIHKILNPKQRTKFSYYMKEWELE